MNGISKVSLMALFVLILQVFPAGKAAAGLVVIPGLSGGGINVQVTSRKEALFETTVRQQYDYSCGSAALATLLTYHYGTEVSEQDVFSWMYEKGDQEKIRREGFSLLDMKNYLEARKFRADGYYVGLDKLAAAGVPAIVLINLQGYRHFVVVKGVTDKRVLVGDPASGIKVMPRDEFEKMWNGLVFIIRNDTVVAGGKFNRIDEWKVRGKIPMGVAVRPNELANVTYLMPGAGYAGP
ncbi:MAG: C39 family peptidase [Syntrophotaleaceae bacterium]